jgi:hypothetical protein
MTGLFLFYLSKSFAVDAECSRWASFKAADAYLYATGFAVSEVVLFKSFKCLVDFANQFALTVAGTKF